MGAGPTHPARMSIIDPPLRDAAASPLAARPAGKIRRRFYLLRMGEALALIAFLSFCVMWVQWQEASPGFYTVSGDFVSFWTAGRLPLEGHAADAYREMPHFFNEL